VTLDPGHLPEGAHLIGEAKKSKPMTVEPTIAPAKPAAPPPLSQQPRASQMAYCVCEQPNPALGTPRPHNLHNPRIEYGHTRHRIHAKYGRCGSGVIYPGACAVVPLVVAVMVDQLLNSKSSKKCAPALQPIKALHFPRLQAVWLICSLWRSQVQTTRWNRTRSDS
jgi:hypothetical protein